MADPNIWVETPYDYCDGGFHPVHQGDKFKSDQYTIIRKLGYGGSSSIWLARDSTDSKLVSVKVFSDDCFEAGINEAACLRILLANNKSGHRYFPTLYDQFEVHGPNGKHVCLVMDFMGPSLWVMLNATAGNINRRFNYFSVEERLNLSAQMILAVAQIHKSGLIHADLHPQNFLFAFPPEAVNWSDDDILSTFGPSKCFQREDFGKCSSNDESTYWNFIEGRGGEKHLPRYLNLAPPLNMNVLDLCKKACSIKIIDFGISFTNPGSSAITSPITPHPVLGIPLMHAAPEVQLYNLSQPTPPLTPSLDIFSLATVIYFLHSRGGYKFEPKWAFMTAPETHCLLSVADMHRFEDYPKWFVEGWKAVDEKAASELQELSEQYQPGVGFREGFVQMLEGYGYGDGDILWFQKVLPKMIKLEPGERIEVQQLVEAIPREWLMINGERKIETKDLKSGSDDIDSESLQVAVIRDKV